MVAYRAGLSQNWAALLTKSEFESITLCKRSAGRSVQQKGETAKGTGSKYFFFIIAGTLITGTSSPPPTQQSVTGTAVTLGGAGLILRFPLVTARWLQIFWGYRSA
ncbi:hypothetical protein NDU88_008134 [Pleurodeles waltl]|uniref:Uncharacterized protein n=1 Tax=Pleurodeles waltl TaxID=8319 RepID=A0AAV7NC75_PLEWA|nr:hypothetical protein NDU88_008134 [Pleurodeles waltl]